MEYNDNMPTYSSSLEIIDPSILFTDGYELSNQTVIESTDYQGSFTPGVNNCEFYIYDANKTIITSNNPQSSKIQSGGVLGGSRRAGKPYLGGLGGREPPLGRPKLFLTECVPYLV